MAQQFKPALILLLFFTCLTGIAYPLLVTFGAQMLFPNQANGSLIINEKQMIGSELIGQPFTRPDFFGDGLLLLRQVLITQVLLAVLTLARVILA